MARNKKILVIQPNTTEQVTKRMGEYARKIASSGVQVDVMQPQASASYTVPGIISFYDKTLATVETLKLVERYSKNYDGIVIGVFTDVGLDEVREAVSIPVLGMGEAAYHMAYILGHKICALTFTGKWTALKERYIKILGLDASRISFSPLPLKKTGEMEFSVEKTVKEGIDFVRRAAREGAEVVILGGSAFVGLSEEIGKQVDIPVIDPFAVALKIMEGLIDLGLKHSKIGIYQNAPEKLGDVKYLRSLK